MTLAAGTPHFPALARNRLGARLRELRQERSLHLAEVAVHLGLNQSSVSRIETGISPLRTSYLSLMLDLYGVTDSIQRKQLADLAREGQRKQWWTGHDDLIPAATCQYLSLEAASTTLKCYSAHQIPDMLATPGYTAATIRAVRPDLNPRQIARLANLLPCRAQPLNQPDQHFHFIVSQIALTSAVASADTMAVQLAKLADNPVITPQIRTSEELSPSFTILGFPGHQQADVGCYHGPAGRSAITRRSADIRAMTATWDALASLALTPADSLTLITELASA